MPENRVATWLLPKGIDPGIASAREEQRDLYRHHGLYSKLTMFQELEEAVSKRPDCTLTYLGDGHGNRQAAMSLAELRRRAMAVAGSFSDMGFSAGDVLAIQLPNWPETLVAYYAASALGMVMLPIVDIYAASELDYILNESRARALVTARTWRHMSFRDRLGGIAPETLEHFFLVGDAATSEGPDGDGVTDWSKLENSGGSSWPDATVPNPSDPVLLLYTSGSTSNPKGVVHSHESLLAEVRLSPLAPPEGDGAGRYLLVSPPGHIAGVLALLRSILFVCDAVILESWDAAVARRAVETYGLTGSAGLFFLQSLLDEFERSGSPIPPMDWAVGGSAVPPHVIEKAEAAGWRAFRSYGSSEHPTVTGSEHTSTLAVRSLTDGRPARGSEVRIVDDDGNDVTVGEEGEIVARGPEQFLGYVAESLNEDVFLRGGWLRTGDVGRLDAEGNLTVTDRTKDIIIRGGENISAREVEEALCRHPLIRDAAAVPYPDSRYGEKVGAFLVLEDGNPVDLEEISELFRSIGMAKQKTPERLIVIDELPRTGVGKVDKRLLRKKVVERDSATLVIEREDYSRGEAR